MHMKFFSNSTGKWLKSFRGFKEIAARCYHKTLDWAWKTSGDSGKPLWVLPLSALFPISLDVSIDQDVWGSGESCGFCQFVVLNKKKFCGFRSVVFNPSLKEHELSQDQAGKKHHNS